VTRTSVINFYSGYELLVSFCMFMLADIVADFVCLRHFSVITPLCTQLISCEAGGHCGWARQAMCCLWVTKFRVILKLILGHALRQSRHIHAIFCQVNKNNEMSM